MADLARTRADRDVAEKEVDQISREVVRLRKELTLAQNTAAVSGPSFSPNTCASS